MRRSLLLLALLATPCAHAQATTPTLNSAALLQSADANKDGKISREEFTAERSKVFATLDRNGDGVLSKDEFRAAVAGGRARLLIEREFATFDTNKDGALSLAEFNAAPTPVFDRADRNKDGVLDASEIAAARRETGR